MPILMTIWEGTRYVSPNILFGVKMYLNITIMSFVGEKQILFNWRKKAWKALNGDDQDEKAEQAT